MDVMVLGHNGMLGHMVVKYLSDKGCNITTCDYKFPTNEFKEFVSLIKNERKIIEKPRRGFVSSCESKTRSKHFY